MAQTGYTPIQLYYSSTTTNVPLAASLASGELAINITDGKLFYKDNANAVQVIGWKTVPATAGGTGQTSYAVGDLIYADTTTTLAKLPDVATGNALISGGVSTAPLWGKIGLSTHVSGTLGVGNGGTGQTSNLTQYGLIYGASTTAMGSTAAGTNTQVLIGNASGAPSWTNTPTLTGTNFTGIPNGGLSNSSITFGSTAVSLGGTVSALNNVTIGATTATTGKFTTLTSTGDTTLVNYQQLTSKQTSLAANTTTTIMTITENSYGATIGGVFEIIIQSGSYPDGMAVYVYSYAAQTSLGSSSWYGGGSSTLIANNSSMNGFSITTAPTFTATKSAGSYGNITITAKANNACTAIVVFRGVTSGVAFS
jgi:hypothetical protein